MVEAAQDEVVHHTTITLICKTTNTMMMMITQMILGAMIQVNLAQLCMSLQEEEDILLKALQQEEESI